MQWLHRYSRHYMPTRCCWCPAACPPKPQTWRQGCIWTKWSTRRHCTIDGVNSSTVGWLLRPPRRQRFAPVLRRTQPCSRNGTTAFCCGNLTLNVLGTYLGNRGVLVYRLNDIYTHIYTYIYIHTYTSGTRAGLLYKLFDSQKLTQT